MTAVTAPLPASVGQTITVGWTVTNAGPGTALGTWADRVYLTDDVTQIAHYRQLAWQDQSAQTGLAGAGGAPNNSYTTAGRSVTIPLDAGFGTRYLVFLTDADGTQPELNDSNNATVQAVTLLPVNLSVASVAADAAASWGQSIHVDYHVQNAELGAALGTWSDVVYLSERTDLSGSYTALHTVGTTERAAGGSANDYWVHLTLTPPSPTYHGAAYVVVKTNADAGQPETLSTDNLGNAALQILAPDLSIRDVDAHVTTAGAGQVLHLTWTGPNDGDGRAMFAWNDYIHISASATFDGSAILLATRAGPSQPAAGATFSASVDVVLPQVATGTWHVYVVADGAGTLAESNEGNNAGATTLTVQDRLGPRVVSTTPTGQINHTVSTVRVVFNEAIDAATFTHTAVQVLTPTGTLGAALVTVTPVDSRTFDVSFPTQAADGTYTLRSCRRSGTWREIRWRGSRMPTTLSPWWEPNGPPR